jgi:CBS domain containing-hemolysin-like protein
VFALNKDLTLKEAVKNQDIDKFSRIPIYNENIDSVVGVVLTKTLLREVIDGRELKLEDIMTEVYKLNENITISKAIKYFIKSKTHMIIITDSYDQTEGVVTLEDCVETVLGFEIMDESDTTEDMRKLATQQMKTKRSNF